MLVSVLNNCVDRGWPGLSSPLDVYLFSDFREIWGGRLSLGWFLPGIKEIYKLITSAVTKLSQNEKIVGKLQQTKQTYPPSQFSSL